MRKKKCEGRKAVECTYVREEKGEGEGTIRERIGKGMGMGRLPRRGVCQDGEEVRKKGDGSGQHIEFQHKNKRNVKSWSRAFTHCGAGEDSGCSAAHFRP